MQSITVPAEAFLAYLGWVVCPAKVELCLPMLDDSSAECTEAAALPVEAQPLQGSALRPATREDRDHIRRSRPIGKLEK